MILGHCLLTGRAGHEAGRALLERLYRQETGAPLPPIAVTDRGKPYFLETDWHFSISHTRHHVFCVLARENIGMDAEELTRQTRPELARKVLSPLEKAQYDAAADPNRALLTFWVLKEAAAKLSGQGLTGYPNQTNFCLEDPRVRELHGCLVAVLRENE